MTPPKITTWVSNGITHEVVTRKGELSDMEWCRIHDDAVAHFQSIYPPD